MIVKIGNFANDLRTQNKWIVKSLLLNISLMQNPPQKRKRTELFYPENAGFVCQNIEASESALLNKCHKLKLFETNDHGLKRRRNSAYEAEVLFSSASGKQPFRSLALKLSSEL